MHILRNINKTILFVLIIILCDACEHEMNLKIYSNDKRLLVNGEFTNELEIHTIRLYCSGGLLTGVPQTAIGGAKIFVTNNTDTFYYVENANTPGLYQTVEKCAGKEGGRYFLSISNIDVDNDGILESYTADEMLPVAVEVYSLKSTHGVDADNHSALNNYAYYRIRYNGPDYLYPFVMLNNKADRTLTDRLGTGELSRNESDYKLPKAENSKVISRSSYVSTYDKATNGDTVCFVGYNFTQKQFNFLKEFDNNANGDLFLDNMYDQLNIPANVSTNIEPLNKAAGYFFIYSISKRSIIFKE